MGAYIIVVNGLPMATRPTRLGAMALVAEKFHGHKDVKVLNGTVVIWTATLDK